MLNFRSVFLITVISVVAQYANAADDDGAAADKDVVSGSQYYCFGQEDEKCHFVGFFNSEQTSQDSPVEIRLINCLDNQVIEKLLATLFMLCVIVQAL